jgi:uncharacterized RmlC-like cupin family protein
VALPTTPGLRSSSIQLESVIVMNSPVRVVSPDRFDLGTSQTPGSKRRAAIDPALGILSGMWGGLFEVKPGSRTGIHHHGNQETIAFVLSGACEIRWGAQGEFVASAKAGDFIHIPAFLPHMESNVSNERSFRWVVVRSTPTPVVVNLPDAVWPDANALRPTEMI